MICPYCEKKLEETYYKELQLQRLPKKYHEEIASHDAKYLSCESCGVYFLILTDGSVYVWYGAKFKNLRPLFPDKRNFFWQKFDGIKEKIVFS